MSAQWVSETLEQIASSLVTAPSRNEPQLYATCGYTQIAYNAKL